MDVKPYSVATKGYKSQFDKPSSTDLTFSNTQCNTSMDRERSGLQEFGFDCFCSCCKGIFGMVFSTGYHTEFLNTKWWRHLLLPQFLLKNLSMTQVKVGLLAVSRFYKTQFELI